MAKPIRKNPDKKPRKVPGKTSSRGSKKAKQSDEPILSFVKEEEMVYVKEKLSRVTVSGKKGRLLVRDQEGKLVMLASAAGRPESQMTPREKMDIARGGITKNDLEGFKKRTGLDYDKLARALSVTRATLINKKEEERFNTALSERIVDLAGLYSYGYEVFEDTGRFNEWVSRPNKALGGLPPFELMDNQFGREEVRNIIGRIDYGVYS